MRGIGWYRARLSAMSPAEIVHRGVASVRRETRRLHARRRTERPPLLAQARARATAGPERPIRFFDVEIGFPDEWPDWSRDYRSGRRGPLSFYGDIDYRDERAVGDSKYTWELNRHQFLVPWAREWVEGRDETAAAAVAAVILDWIAENPRYRGLNWGSALEVGLRLLSWGLALELAGDAPVIRDARPLVLRSVSEQADYVRYTLSAYSSANNHLLGELVGLLAAGVLFPDARGASAHAGFAVPRFVEEMRRQNFEDGVNREQAVYYHHYVTEYLLVGMRLLERLGRPVPPDLPTLAHRMLRFVDATTDERGRPLAIGDADEGVVSGFNLDSPVGAFESLLWTAWVAFDDDEAGAHAARIAAKRGGVPAVDQRTAYWHGPPSRPLPMAGDAKDARWVFPQGGYVIQRAGEASVTFRAGPFGYPSIAAHAHCDQLSVLLAIGDTVVLGDSGTGAYHTEPRWRRYFRGTSAHNTVRVDGRDQAEYEGPFLWGTHAEGTLRVERDDPDRLDVSGAHAGYRRLADPVSHERRLTWTPGGGYRIEDHLAGAEGHRFELFWNLGPGLRLVEAALPFEGGEDAAWQAAWRVRCGERTLCTLVTGCDRLATGQVRRGDEEEPAGFASPRYLVFRPVEQLCVSAEGSSCRFSTRILLGDPVDVPAGEGG